MKNKKHYFITFRPVLTALLFIFLMPVAVEAQTTVTVNSLLPQQTGVNYTTLPTAIAFANANANTTIQVIDADIGLAAVLDITQTTTITGILSGEGAPLTQIKMTGTDRHFSSSTPSIILTFQNLAILGPNAAYNNGVITDNGGSDNGGGIAATSTTITLNIESCVIAGCNATGSGGGIYAACLLNLSGNNIVSYNKAGWTGSAYSATAYTGGGIHAGIPFTKLTGTLICKGNGASGSGGGIYKVPPTSAPYPVSFTTTGLTLLQVDGNESKSSGGGIYTSVSVDFNDLQKGSSVSGNTAIAGGGIYLDYSLTLNNTVVNDNIATGTSTAHSGLKPVITGGGGGICAAAISSVVILNNCTIDNNRTESYGGGLYFVTTQSAPSMAPTLNSCTVTNNSSANSGGGVFAWGHLALKGKNNISYNKAGLKGTTYSQTAYGGGICVNDFALNIVDTLICKGNVAGGYGGGIYKTSSSNGSTPFTVTDLKLLQLDDNESKTAGGGVYSTNSIEFSKKLPKGSSISGNRAGTIGGGICTGSSSEHLIRLSLSNLTISYNTAGNSGGGVFSPGPLTLSGNNTVSYNKAGWTGTAYSTSTSYTGGGIHTKVGLTLMDTLICIGNGASGNGGGIYKVTSTSTSTPYYPTIFNVANLKLLQADGNESRAAGGAIYTANSINLRNLQKGSSISGNTAKTSGGGIYTSVDTAALTLNNTAVKNNTASSTGGGIYASAALTLMNNTISDNTAASHGGGIYATNILALTGKNTISNNKAGWTGTAYNAGNYYGGGVYATNKLTLSDTLICNNNATSSYGGGIYKSSTTAIIDATSIKFLQLNNNAAGKATTNGSGGGAYLAGSATVGADFSNATSIEIIGNTATNGGGGIYSSGPLSLKNATVSDNEAVSHGGGIYANNALTLSGNNTISNNKAGWDKTAFVSTSALGGGILAMGNLIFSDTLTCNSNIATGSGGGINKNTATATINATGLNVLQLNNNVAGKSVSGSGGGAYLAGSATVGADFSNATIDGNTASGNGGGIYSSGTLLFKNATISNNIAGSSGGGIYATNSLTLTRLSIVSENAAAAYGGGIYAGSSLSLNGNNTISDNKAGYTGAAYSATAYYGGGMYVGGNMILSDTLICNNNMASGYGGGIFKNTATATINATGLKVLQLNNNVAGKGVAGAGGGGAYLAGSATVGADFSNVASVEIDGNIASGSGGGINSAGTLSFKNAIIRNNTAGINGGAIFISAPLTLDDMTISGNKAGWNGTAYSGTGDGGGIYAGNSLVLKGNIVFDRDSASQHGGGIFKGSGVFDVSGITSLKISNGAAVNSSSNGGGIYTSVSITFPNGTSSEITNNNAGGFGGGIYTNAAVTLSNFTVSENRSGSHGGGIYAIAALTMNNMTISDNISGGSGGGILSGPSAALVFNNVDISGNSAMGHGGGVFAGNVLTLNTTNVLNNKAGHNALTGIWTTTLANGGGIYASTDLTLQGAVVFMNDTTTQHGGAIYKSTNSAFNTVGMTLLKLNLNTARTGSGGGIWTNAALNLPGTAYTEITGNKANVNGGGIYTSATLTLNNSIVSENKAKDGGGIYVTGILTSINNTFSLNAAEAGTGGAVHASANTNISFTTLNGNTASTNTGNAIYFNNAAGKTLNGNIIYGNGTGSEINVAPATAKYNIVRNMDLGATNRNAAAGKADSIFTVANNATGLATLADNGGPTQTLDIKRNGYAYNFIPNNIAASWASVTTDQRGLPRPSGCKTDAGAVELQVGDQETPDVTILGASNACTGDEVEFLAQATGSGKLSYLWSATPDGTITGNGITTQESFTWIADGIKTVTMTVTDSENCDTTATTAIEIMQRPVPGPLNHVPNLQ